MCVPFFIMAGSLMNTAGITERIYSFAVALVGWMKGGLGQVNVVGSVIFAGMSGTAVADAAGLGTIEIKAMKDHGYDPQFAVGITAASSILGPILPPSLPMVLYGITANASIGQLFAAGIFPGLLLAACLMGIVAYYAHVRGYHRDAQVPAERALALQTKRAFLPLMTPVILIGGMRIGVFTPTEAAIAAVRLCAVPRPVRLPLAELPGAGQGLDRDGGDHRGGAADRRRLGDLRLADHHDQDRRPDRRPGAGDHRAAVADPPAGQRLPAGRRPGDGAGARAS